jgi:hypothetical protein
LLERLKKGKKFSTGQRKEFWGSTFELGKAVKVVSKDGNDFITTRDDVSKHDDFEETPAF